jgi:oxidase EvaA
MREAHTVNMDTRMVIAAIPLVTGPAEADAAGRILRRDDLTFADALLESTLAGTNGCQPMDAVLSWLTESRASAAIDSQPCGLDAIRGWEWDAFELRRLDGRYFKVCAVGVESDAREIATWTQPMIQPVDAGVSAFVTKRIDGRLHFLVQARMEPGVWNLIELGPTVQYLPGTPLDDAERPFMLHEVLDGTAGVTRHRSTQCEEGGRFYRYVTENIVVELTRVTNAPCRRIRGSRLDSSTR